MEDLRAWFDAILQALSAKSDMAGAIRYAISRWTALTRYLDDGEVEIPELRFTEAEAINQIESKAVRFIVRDEKGHEAVVEVEERDGRKFLITKRDHYTTDNLGSLPECSSKPIVVPPPYRPVPPARFHCVRGDWTRL